MSKFVLAAAVLALGAAAAAAEVKTKKVEYKHGDATFVGHLAWDDAVAGKRPGVLVVHEWWGLNAHAKERAEKLAEMGYVAFACDMYGDGKLAAHPDDARKMSGEVRKNVKEWQARAAAALTVLSASEFCDADRLGAMGFCFGGSTALQLAASGAKLKAVVTFHAALPPFKDGEAKAIAAKVLICHGKDDVFISADSIAAFKAAMDAAEVSYTFEEYDGTVHSFTDVNADKVMIKGMAYNKAADEKSWASMTKLFAEAFKK